LTVTVTEATAGSADDYLADATPGDSEAQLRVPGTEGKGRAVFFGERAAPLFGWLHRGSGPLGLVICDPFGNESICAHRSLKQLAERAAVAGIPTVRFDYAGTGNSAGHDFEPDRLAAWVASIQAAADELRAATGVTQLCFLGIRLGATLAMLAAAERADVTSLIAFAPVVSGKAYIRELRMLQRASAAKRNIARQGTDDTIETAGFTLTASTQAAVSALDLLRMPIPAGIQLLILDRAELPGAERWEQHLREAGATVERVDVPGFTEMMLDCHESIVPRDMLATTLAWLQGRQQAATARDPAKASVNTAANRVHLTTSTTTDPVVGEQSGEGVEETAVHFGSTGGLFGIVSAPAGRSPGTLQPESRGIILLNSGAQHHVGPCRLYVALARHLARRGHVVLRMDIAGIGASPPRAGAEENVVYPPHGTEDVRAAIDYLREKWKRKDVRAAGLCSGAYHAFKAASAGMPLNGIVVINPLTFFWRDGMSLKFPEHRVAADIMRYRASIFRPASWFKLLSGRVNLWESAQVLLRRARSLVIAPLRSAARTLGTPFSNDLPSELQAIVRNGIDLRFVFAQDDPGVELLRDQGGTVASRLRAAGAIRVDTIAGADHTFTDRALRAQLVTVLERALCG
jgi:alpha-beta hydrolase superfamily lysophospholipase